MTDSEFTSLLEETHIAFEQSDIKHYAIENKEQWFYSITATPIKQDRLLLIGFNWGASAGVSYSPQSKVPDTWFMDMANEDLGSFKRIKSLLGGYCPGDLDEVGQTNFCFFRSDSEWEITAKDLALSTPVFERLLDIARPKGILGFSSRLREHLVASERFAVTLNESIPYKRGEKNSSCTVVKGVYKIDTREIPVALLPHPNSPLPGAVRQKAWELCLGEQMSA